MDSERDDRLPKNKATSLSQTKGMPHTSQYRKVSQEVKSFLYAIKTRRGKVRAAQGGGRCVQPREWGGEEDFFLDTAKGVRYTAVEQGQRRGLHQ